MLQSAYTRTQLQETRSKLHSRCEAFAKLIPEMHREDFRHVVAKMERYGFDEGRKFWNLQRGGSVFVDHVLQPNLFTIKELVTMARTSAFLRDQKRRPRIAVDEMLVLLVDVERYGTMLGMNSPKGGKPKVDFIYHETADSVRIVGAAIGQWLLGPS